MAIAHFKVNVFHTSTINANQVYLISYEIRLMIIHTDTSKSIAHTNPSQQADVY